VDRKNIKLLHIKSYKVSWKADGARYMMLIQEEGEIYFFDRDNSCFKVDDLTFPPPRDPNKQLCNTLLDGEVVIDHVKAQSFPRYLVYDIIRYENEDYGKKTFSK